MAEKVEPQQKELIGSDTLRPKLVLSLHSKCIIGNRLAKREETRYVFYVLVNRAGMIYKLHNDYSKIIVHVFWLLLSLNMLVITSLLKYYRISDID